MTDNENNVLEEMDDNVVVVRPTDGKPAARFRGEKIGFASTERPRAHRWTEFHVWRTSERGQIVLMEAGVTRLEGERDYATIKVFDSIADMTAALGYTKLSQKLYRDVEIDEITIL